MIKLSIKTETETHHGTLPDSWNEIKVRDFIGMNSGLTELELIALLSGIDVEHVENAKNDLTPIVERMNELFNEPPPDLQKLKRKVLTMDGKKIVFPTSINFTRYGQKSMVKNLIQSNDKLETIVPDVFAIYAQPIVDGKFDSNRIEAIKKQVENMPIVDVFPHVFFFFKKLKGLKIHLLTKSNQFQKHPHN